MIVHDESTEDVKDYVHSVVTDFQNANIAIDDIGIPGGIQKEFNDYDSETAQVRGAKYANLLLGTNFQRGSKPKRLYLNGVHPDFWERVDDELALDPRLNDLYREFRRNTDVICYEYPDQVPSEFRIDRTKMLNKTLKKPISRVLRAVDISWEDAKSGTTQAGLGGFATE